MAIVLSHKHAISDSPVLLPDYFHLWRGKSSRKSNQWKSSLYTGNMQQYSLLLVLQAVVLSWYIISVVSYI